MKNYVDQRSPDENEARITLGVFSLNILVSVTRKTTCKVEN